MAKPIKTEVNRIKSLLADQDISKRQRFALMIALDTLYWVDSLRKNNVPETPSQKVMKVDVVLENGVSYTGTGK